MGEVTPKRTLGKLTQIHEDYLKEGSGRVDTYTRRLHKRGLWMSGHRYMNSGDRRAVEEWTQVHEQW
jgi:hypothetical protein